MRAISYSLFWISKEKNIVVALLFMAMVLNKSELLMCYKTVDWVLCKSSVAAENSDFNTEAWTLLSMAHCYQVLQ
jgi:hypothetical protein